MYDKALLCEIIEFKIVLPVLSTTIQNSPFTEKFASTMTPKPKTAVQGTWAAGIVKIFVYL